MPTRNLTIMFTDIKGFTKRVSEGRREEVVELRDTHDRLLVPVFAHFDGVVIKTIGDAFLVRFDSPTDAVLCGVTIQEVLRQHNQYAPADDQLNVRVAINVGEVELMDDDVLGEPVNIAARLEDVAEPGEVYFTEAVYLAMNRNEAPSSEVGERTFKGIPYPIRVFKVMTEPNSELAKRLAANVELTKAGPVIRGMHRARKREGRRTALVLGGVLGLLIVAGLVVVMMLPSKVDRCGIL